MRFFLGQVDDSVIFYRYLCKISTFHVCAEFGIVGLGVLAVGNRVIDGANQHHNGNGDEQGHPDIQFGAFIIPGFVILGMVAIGFHRR